MRHLRSYPAIENVDMREILVVLGSKQPCITNEVWGYNSSLIKFLRNDLNFQYFLLLIFVTLFCVMDELFKITNP